MTRAAALVAGSSTAAVALYRNRDSGDNNNPSSRSLLVAQWQAAGRALRLTGTCMLMWADYKVIPLVSSISSFYNHDPNTDENAALRLHWQQEYETRKAEFDQAQTQYTTKHSMTTELSPKERAQLKQREKQAMIVAAQRLAEAHDELAALGNDTASRVHQTAASRLLRLCHANRGVYIKVGQHLANLDYLLPSEYITTLSTLYDDTPVTDFATVCRVVEQELGAHPLDLFDSFDPIPIASASLAQVHVAYRHGVKLAVKVQHDGLRETSVGDVANLTLAVRLAERFVSDFSLGWLADEIAPNLFKELDFAHEGRNADQAREHLATTGLSCVIPQIKWDLTSARVLTMEFEEGFKATDVESIERAGLSRHDVSTLIASVFASQVFGSGHVHCDPHEANVLVRAQDGKPVLVLVDHGLYQTLDNDFSQQYALLWKSLMLADLKGIEAASRGLGLVDPDSYRLFAGMLLARPFDEVVERARQGSLQRRGGPRNNDRSDQTIIQGYAQRYLPNIMALLAKLPRQMLLLLKMNDCLRHIDFRLGYPANTLLVTGRYAAQSLYQNGQLCDQSLAKSSLWGSWIGRWRNWWSYMHILVRIQMHEMTLWWLRTTGQVPFSHHG
jgi:aarF domain-containing kinase